MKRFNKAFILLLMISGLAFTSCETSDLDLLNDPNNLTTSQAQLDRLMNNIQLDFNSFTRQMGNNGAALTRINNMFGRTYADNFDPVSLNGEWSVAYQGMFSNMQLAETYAVAQEANKHLGVIKILKAYTLITLVDFVGDVPLTQATQPVEFPSPIADPAEDVYTAALAMLDEGIALIAQDGVDIETDFFYENDFGKWRKAANTFKMQAYLSTRLVDGSAAGKFNAIASSSANYISSTSDDMEFRYGSNVTSPDTRHPAYANDYTVTGAGSYRSNWLMNEMLNDNDPRRRYYFFRQTNCTPGATGCPTDPVRLQCSVTVKPDHYLASMVFCYVEDGYWGRDHGNGEGIPPDGFQRTTVGVYPYGGKFDDGVIGDEGNHPFGTVTPEAGGAGAGINPVMLASWADLMRAEMFLASNSTSSASNALRSALEKSTSKAASFISLDPDADSSVAPTGADVSSFINAKISEFSNASSNDKWEVLARQSLIGHYGNGIGAYNFYRRTGYPTELQYALDPNPGSFVRSFFYPANEANVNSNIVQKDGVDTQVFWDNNPPSPGFPPAN